MRPLARAVLLIGDARLRDGIARALTARWGTAVVASSGREEEWAILDRVPDLLVLETPLAKGDALRIARTAARMLPSPLQIAIGGDGRAEVAFRLGQEGVRDYVTKPFTLDALVARIEAARCQAPVFDSHLKGLVGHRALRAVQSDVRHLMVTEAMARAGSRGGAARLLRVSRQAVQQAVRGFRASREDPDLEERVSG